MSLSFNSKTTAFLMFLSLGSVAGCIERPDAPDQGPLAPTGNPRLVIISQGQDHCGSPIDVLIRNTGDVDYGGGATLTVTVDGQQEEKIIPQIASGEVFVVPIDPPTPLGGDYSVAVAIANQPPAVSSCIG